MAAPARRILTHAISSRGGKPEHAFDSAKQPTRRHPPRVPERLQHLDDVRGVDIANEQVAENRISVCDQRRTPLLPVPGVASQAVGMKREEGFSALPKRFARRQFLPRAAFLFFFLAPDCERVAAVEQLQS
jgi:hypothetical protein